MTRMRFPIAASLAALAFGAAAPAYAQQARIDDIQVSREAETVSILVKLSQQPSAATVKASGDDLVVEIEGLALSQLKLDPPAGSLVRHVDAAGAKVTLSGAAFGDASTVIYRNAVLIEAKLAEPSLRGSSLMANATQTPLPSPKTAPAATAPSPKPLVAEAPPPAKPPEPSALESHPAPVLAGAPSAPQKLSTASLAKIDTARCAAAALDLSKDPWELTALGDHALCLIDSGKDTEAKTKLDQLAAFSPEDWRVALGRAALAAVKGDASTAETGYRTAAMLAPDATVRAAITTRADQAAGR